MLKSFKVVIALAIFTIISCNEFSTPEYQNLPAADKMNKLWSKIIENPKTQGWFSKLRGIGIFLEGMKESFDWVGDTMLYPRKKYIHTVGAVGKVEFIKEPGSPYTGIFEGCKNVLLRISLAKEPDLSKTTAEGADENYTPGFGIKFLRDNQPSANLISMYSVNGQPSWNYFKKDFSNHIPTPAGFALGLLKKKFETAQKEVGVIGLRPLADYTEKGESRTANSKFPFKLVWRPTKEATALGTDDYRGVTFLEEFAKIPVGMTIYDVMAQENPNAELKKIGTIKTTSKFTQSLFGDSELFIQHNYINYDYELHPDWKLSSNDEVLLEDLMKFFHS